MSSVSKLHFKVVGCTGWEDDYHPKNMEVNIQIGPYRQIRRRILVTPVVERTLTQA